MINVLLLYRELIPSVRLCAYEQLKYLNDKGEIKFHPCQIDKLNKDLINLSDIVIYVRADNHFESKLSDVLKRIGKYQIYILDDDLLNISQSVSSYSHYNNKYIRKNILTTIKNCDCLLSPSANILAKYGKLVKSILQIEESVPVYFKKNIKENTSIKIGFAGSIDRSSDFDESLCNALRILQNKYGNKISFDFFGAKPPMGDLGNVNYYTYCENYDEYQVLMDELNWDIGIAPMPETEFHKFKHYNKLIEYSTFGIAGVYSNVSPYKEVIKNEINGILCNNTTKDWIDALSRYIDNPKMIKSVKENCVELVLNDFSIEKSSNILLLYFRSLKCSNKCKNIRFFILLKYYCFILKIWYFIKRNKTKSFKLIIRKIKK